MKEKKKNSFLEKYKWLIFIGISPVLIIIVLHIGNWINKICPKINFNPIGIGNTEWLSFWGGYLGCIFTFFIFTETFKQNKRDMSYSAEMERINQEMKLISEVISSINPLVIFDLTNRINHIEVIDGIFSDSQINVLLSDINNIQTKMLSYRTRLNLETSILDNDCSHCEKFEDCELREKILNFQKTYHHIYMKVYQILIDCNEYIEVISYNAKMYKQKMDNEKNIERLEYLASTSTIEYQKKIDILIKDFNDSLSKLKRKDADSIFHRIEDGVEFCKEINYKYMSELITLTKFYEYERQNRAKLILAGKEVLEYVRDDEKYEKCKDDFIKTQQEELELYCPNIYKKDVDNKNENNN